jgi:AraC-like DNA-binding protein
MEIKDDFYSLKNQIFPLTVGMYGHEPRVKSHFHDFIEITYVAQGFAMHRINKDISLILPGDLFFILPGAKHEYWKSINNKVYNCIFYPEVLGEDLKEIIELPYMNQIFSPKPKVGNCKIHLSIISRLEIISILRKLEIETNKKPIGWELRSKALLMEFLICLSRAWVDGNETITLPDNEIAASASMLSELLKIPFKYEISIEDIAQKAGYTPEHFSRTFKKLSGLSPSTYFTSLKIASAAEMLLNTKASIAQIAESIGFEDINYFSRVFKKETGMTPSSFRVQNSLQFGI